MGFQYMVFLIQSIFNTWFGHAKIGHWIFNTWCCIAWPASSRALSAAFGNICKGGRLRPPPLVYVIENVANNALNDADHAMQNHVLTIICIKSPMPNLGMPTMY